MIDAQQYAQVGMLVIGDVVCYLFMFKGRTKKNEVQVNRMQILRLCRDSTKLHVGLIVLMI